MKNTNFKASLLGAVLLCTLFISCQKEDPILTKFEQDRQTFREHLAKAESSITTRGGDPFPCEFQVTSNCTTVTIPLDWLVEIGLCATNTTQWCEVSGEMEITICTFSSYVSINFEETLFGHDLSCITGAPHDDDWDCIANLYYEAYVNYMMSVILTEFVDANYAYCGTEDVTIVSNYTRKQCVYPCTVQVGTSYYTTLLECGSSTACCIEKTQWCLDRYGIAHKTPLGTYQIGQCDPGELPCRNNQSPFPAPATCRPRDCIQAL